MNEHSDGEIYLSLSFEDGDAGKIIGWKIFEKGKEVSEDPFNLYSLLKRQNKLDDKDTNSEDSLKHPPGFTPLTHNCENDTSEKKAVGNSEVSFANGIKFCFAKTVYGVLIICDLLEVDNGTGKLLSMGDFMRSATKMSKLDRSGFGR
ncbi:hypothetical protein Tco_1344026 [Tanacetum coccineum]